MLFHLAVLEILTQRYRVVFVVTLNNDTLIISLSPSNYFQLLKWLQIYSYAKYNGHTRHLDLAICLEQRRTKKMVIFVGLASINCYQHLYCNDQLTYVLLSCVKRYQTQNEKIPDSRPIEPHYNAPDDHRVKSEMMKMIN